jgi:hypothetical protein
VTHAAERALGRLAEAGINGAAVLSRAERLARKLDPSLSYGVLMATLPEPRGGRPWGAESNGNEVWAIIRQRRVVTLMLRRSEQRRTPEAMRVDRVGRATEATAA